MIQTHRATGTFTVRITPEDKTDAGPGPASAPTGRMGLHKVFAGGLAGEAVGTMLSVGAPGHGRGAMGYVAIDQFHGRVDGREGGFVLLHRGTLDGAGGRELSVIVAPGSGTGALQGLAGTLDIDIRDGVHHYALDYTLPDAPAEATAP